MSQAYCDKNLIQFINPINGDVLNEFDGQIKGKSLEIKVKLLAGNQSRVIVNGVPATIVNSLASKSDCCCSFSKGEGTLYEAAINLDGYRNTVVAVDENSGCKNEMVVYWLKNATGKYRISMDDNIWFLKDIAKNSDKYKSIFENPYLKLYKDVHDMYGTKVHINLFYQTEGFNLSQMPDKYKSEWKDNAHWIKLTFHSLQEFPDRPYANATYDEIKKDYELITNEIIRFAGEELLSPVTTVHWGATSLEAARALRTMGMKGLVGYFKFAEDGAPLVSYYHDNERIKHINKRDYWKDDKEDIMFVKHDIVLDGTNLKDICPFLDNLKKDPHQSGLIEMLIHEQYFYPHYKAYQPEYREKVMTAARWATENGYKPAFWSDVVFEK
ncbi:MAG TPA: hypothetical protein PK733_11365 [Clostridiales bacterium]|nr:hypothetical protein [Clostridiales bacterium]